MKGLIIPIIVVFLCASFSWASVNTEHTETKLKATQIIANLVKDKIRNVTPEMFQEEVTLQYKRLMLIDHAGEWKHPKFAEISDQLIFPISKEMAFKFIDQMAEVAQQNNYLVNFLEDAINKEFFKLRTVFEIEGEEILLRVVAYAFVLESLTKAQVNDVEFLHACLQTFRANREEVNLTFTDMNPFSFAKLYSVEKPIKDFIKFHRTKRIPKTFLRNILPLNIFEAMLVDYYHGFKDNANSSKPLIINRPTKKMYAGLNTGPAHWSKDGKEVLVKLPVGKQWTDLYQTWNMAFISQFRAFPFFLVKLIIPSVNDYKARPEQFIYRRAISLYTHLHYFFLGDLYDEYYGIPHVDWNDTDLTRLWGKHNLKSSKHYKKLVRILKIDH